LLNIEASQLEIEIAYHEGSLGNILSTVPHIFARLCDSNKWMSSYSDVFGAIGVW